MTELSETSLYLQSNKDEATDLARKVPIEMLAIEWLNQIDASIETRAYLVENFLPVLVLGCEKVLKEAHKRNLIQENKSDLNYNPINFLAQFLMRNNPKYNNHNETSSYVRTLRQVYQELREQMFAFQENRLAKIKADVRQRRDEREKQEKLKQIEKDRRKTVIDGLFHKWLISMHGRLEMAVVQSMFDMYHNQIQSLPHEMQPFAKLNLRSIPAICFTHDKINHEKRLLKTEFVQCLINVSENMSSEIFDFFTGFVQDCADYFIYLANKTSTNKIFFKLFELLDTTKSGFLSRRRILDTLMLYYQQNESKFRDPIKWPVLDPYIKFENENLLKKEKAAENALDSEKNEDVKSALLDNVELEANAEANVLNEAKIMEKGPESAAETNIKRETESLSEMDKLSSLEGESLNRMTAVGEHQALENMEQIEEDSEKKENFKSESQPDTRRSIEDDSKRVSIDKEILFIKGGIMYYMPLREPLNAFDRAMISNDKQQIELTKFNTDYLTPPQFVNLLNNFCFSTLFKSESDTNHFITYLKDSFFENQMEKNMKLEYFAHVKKLLSNEEKFSKIFDRLDNEGSGYLELDQIIMLLERFKDGMYKDTIQSISYAMRQELLKKTENTSSEEKENLEMNKEEFIQYLTVLIDQVKSPIFADQMCQYLSNVLQFDYAQRVRGEHRKTWLEQIRNIGEVSVGSFEPLYKQLFSGLLKDSENHGEGKNVSAYVAILEKTNSNEIALRYHASTPHDSKFILGKLLTRKQGPTSFNVVDTGNLIHIPRVRTQNAIHYFDSQCDRDGSLALLPLSYRRNRVYGIIGIDTLHEPSNRSYFQEHEIKFYKGVATTFARSFANIIYKNRLIKCCISAIDWIKQRCKTVQECKLYFVETINSEHTPQESKNVQSNINLKQVIKYSVKEQVLHDSSTVNTHHRSKSHSSSKSGDRQETPTSNSYIGPHVYECAISSESTVGYFGTDSSYCYPLRNEDHKTIFVFEALCKGTEKDSNHDLIDIQQVETVFYVLHKCQEELLEENLLGKTKNDFEFEDLYEQEKSEILFEKKYYNHVFEQLKAHTNEVIADPANLSNKSSGAEAASNVINVTAELLKFAEFSDTKLLTQEFLNKLRLLDPTSMNFSFNAVSSKKIDLSSKDIIEKLHSMQIQLQDDYKLVAFLIDWLCILKALNDKTAKSMQKHEK